MFAVRNAVLAATVLVAACEPTSAPTSCCPDAADTLATALVNGRPATVPLGAWKDNGLGIIGGMGGTVFMIAYRPATSGAEGMQFWLDGFHGVGAYPVTGDGSDGSSTTVYWKGPVQGGVSYWNEPGTGDTVWVTSFDTITRAIEGHFSMSGWNGDTVKVTDGHYRGVVHDYVPSP